MFGPSRFMSLDDEILAQNPLCLPPFGKSLVSMDLAWVDLS